MLHNFPESNVNQGLYPKTGYQIAVFLGGSVVIVGV